MKTFIVNEEEFEKIGIDPEDYDLTEILDSSFIITKDEVIDRIQERFNTGEEDAEDIYSNLVDDFNDNIATLFEEFNIQSQVDHILENIINNDNYESDSSSKYGPNDSDPFDDFDPNDYEVD